MGLKWLALAAAAALLTSPASAQKTRFDGLLGCERRAAVQFKLHNTGFRRFVIDRQTVETDHYADTVGNQFIATIYHGRAIIETTGGTRIVRFLCLHAGVAKGPVFVYTLD